VVIIPPMKYRYFVAEIERKSIVFEKQVQERLFNHEDFSNI
jgi:hypothetical protein